ncbi:MAG: hypothetical protein ABI186_02925 [Candidatus Elarobacter sp.]
MHVPSAEELAAIAAAYVVATQQPHADPARGISRWSLAGRVDDGDIDAARALAVRGSRWSIAGRLARS